MRELLTPSAFLDGVRKFMRACGQKAPEKREPMTEEDRLLSAKLLLEETFETISAMGVSVYHSDADVGWLDRTSFDLQANGQHDEVETIDGLADVNYITAGIFARMGLPDRPFFDEVHRNNMLKVEHGTFDENGKLLKPVGHPKPDLKGVLADVIDQQLAHQAEQRRHSPREREE